MPVKFEDKGGISKKGGNPLRLVILLGLCTILVACSNLLTSTDISPADRSTEGATDAPLPEPRRSGAIDGTAGRGADSATVNPQKPIIERGTGVFLGPPRAKLEARANAAGEITLNFVEADVREVIRSVLGNILRLNYAVDSSVKGMITLQTSNPLPREAVLPALESALRLNSVAIVKEAQLYRVVPLDSAPTQGAPLSVGEARSAAGPGFTIRIVPLRYVSASEMQNILAPVAPKGSILRVDKARNLLMLAAPQQELAGLEETIRIFDVDWLKGMSFAVIPLEFVDPETLVKELNAVLLKEDVGPLKDVLQFVPVKRLNSVIAISTQPEYLDRARDFVAKLDRGGSGSGRQLFVYYIQNGRAVELAETLGKLFGASGTSGSGLATSAVAPQLRAERLDIARSSMTRPTASSGPQASRSATPPPGAGSQGASEALTAVPRNQSRPAGPALNIQGETDQIRIVADAATNAILVWAAPSDYKMVRNVLQKLDLVPLQVLIEATIAEVTLNDELRYGVQWFFRSGQSQLSLSSGTSSSVVPTFPGFSYFLTGNNVRAVLDALESVTTVKVISSPTLMVLDNQTAVLQVGDEVPVLSQQIQQTTNLDAPVVNSVSFKDTGIILQVSPRVNANGLVLMEITQEASQVVETKTSGIDSPTIQQRRITSSVAVQSGDSVALGGMIQDFDDRGNTGVPLLKDIPLLGYLFGAQNRTKRRTELLVLITPRAIRNQQEVQSVTEELRKRMKTVIPLGRKIQ